MDGFGFDGLMMTFAATATRPGGKGPQPGRRSPCIVGRGRGHARHRHARIAPPPLNAPRRVPGRFVPSRRVPVLALVLGVAGVLPLAARVSPVRAAGTFTV